MDDNLQELIAQRDQLDKRIEDIRVKIAADREAAWTDIEVALQERASGTWRKNDYVFTVNDIVMTMVNRTGGWDTYLTIYWDGSNKAEFSDPPPVAAVLAFIDAL